MYVHPILVDAAAIDENGHVNNVQYVQWMQDAAIAHSRACGGTALSQAANATWVVRTHHVEYLRPAFLGDALEVRTWIDTCKRVSSTRKYEFHRGDVLVARGETDWVYVDATTARPQRVPAGLYAAFGVQL